MNHLPQDPENLIRVISNFFQFASQGAPPVSMTPVVNLLKVPLVSSIPVAKLPPVSNDTSGKIAKCQWQRWLIFGTISDCLHLKVNLKKKIIYMLTLLLKGVKKCLNLLIEDFFYLPPVSMTLAGQLELRVSPRIFEKIRNCPNRILRGLG